MNFIELQGIRINLDLVRQIDNHSYDPTYKIEFAYAMAEGVSFNFATQEELEEVLDELDLFVGLK